MCYFCFPFSFMVRKLVIFPLLLLLSACNNGSSDTIGNEETDATPRLINYSTVSEFPHDTTSFTEGFLFHNGQLYESTGYDSDFASTRSLFGVVDLKTGRIQPKVEIDKKKYFGEGVVFLKGKVYQLTYKTKIGFVYDEKTFKKLGDFSFPSVEGWGLTTDGRYLIMSDGTSNISFLDPDNFKLVKILGVTDNNGPLGAINELEYINNFIYANLYGTDYIVKIDPASGKVAGRLDLTSLAEEAKTRYPEALEMNGIAYDSVTKSVYVTGKMWPTIYEIKFNF
jgi:glutamine cyclotransferase